MPDKNQNKTKKTGISAFFTFSRKKPKIDRHHYRKQQDEDHWGIKMKPQKRDKNPPFYVAHRDSEARDKTFNQKEATK